MFAYVAPKTVSMRLTETYPVLPKEAQHWVVTVRYGINIREPEVDNHTGPKGRLKRIRPIHLQYHHISPSGDEKATRTRDWKLHEKGWKGMSVYHISPFEEQAIAAWIGANKDRVWPQRPYNWTVDDERPGDIGDFVSRNRCIYFENAKVREDFEAMLAALPVRTIEMYVDRKKIPRECRAALKGFNHMFTRGEDADLFTGEESIPPTVLMMLRFKAGAEKPV